MKLSRVIEVSSLCLAAIFFALPVHSQDRIASLGGDITEIIYALGEGDRIIATDSTSVYPPAALATPKVGYVRQLSAEGVLSIEPDLILISGAAGPETALDQIRATGVPIVEMQKPYTIGSIIEKTKLVSASLGVEEKGEALVQQIEADWEQASTSIAGLGSTPRVLFFSMVGDGTPTAAGIETAGHGVIEMIGGTNVFDTHEGYKPISLEAAVAADPDVILVMDFLVERLGGLEAVVNHPALSLTRAVQNDRVILVDAVRVMQFSSRTPAAAGELAQDISERLQHGEY